MYIEGAENEKAYFKTHSHEQAKISPIQINEAHLRGSLGMNLELSKVLRTFWCKAPYRYIFLTCDDGWRGFNRGGDDQ